MARRRKVTWGGRRPGAGAKPGSKWSDEAKERLKAKLDATPVPTSLATIPAEPKRGSREAIFYQKQLDEAAMRVRGEHQAKLKDYHPFRLPAFPPNAIPPSGKMAMDSAGSWAAGEWAGAVINATLDQGLGFLGYPFLSELAQRPEYRVISETIADDATRKWIDYEVTGDKEQKDKEKQENDRQQNFGSGGDKPFGGIGAQDLRPEEDIEKTPGRGFTDEDPDDRKKKLESSGKMDKVKRIRDEFERLEVRDRLYANSRDDGFFGRSHLYMNFGEDVDGADDDELMTDIGSGRDATSVGKVSPDHPLRWIKVVEPVWTYPLAYNANNPLKPTFYTPQTWYVLGRQLHVNRILPFIGHPVPDLLKPAYSFGGVSLSQLAMPYVNIWLQTRDSVGALIHSFSVMVLMTDLQTTLQPGGSGPDGLLARANAFNAFRDNKGLFLLNKNTEDFKNVSASLGGLHELQAQSQEHMMSVVRIPDIKFTGINPTGLNASTEGVMRAYYDTIKAYQNRFMRPNLTRIFNFVQLSLFGEIDPEITFEFEPLREMSEKEGADLQKADAERDKMFVDGGAISPEEWRGAIIDDPNLPFADLNPEDVPELKQEEMGGLMPPGAGKGGLEAVFGDPADGGAVPGGAGPTPGAEKKPGEPAEKEPATDEEVVPTGLPWAGQYEFMRGYHLPARRSDDVTIVKDAPRGGQAAQKGLRVGSRLRHPQGAGRVAGFSRGPNDPVDVVAVLDLDNDRFLHVPSDRVSTRPVIAGDSAMPVFDGMAIDYSRLALDLAKLAMDLNFEEGKHPRADNGKFGKGSGGGGSPTEAGGGTESPTKGGGGSPTDAGGKSEEAAAAESAKGAVEAKKDPELPPGVVRSRFHPVDAIRRGKDETLAFLKDGNAIEVAKAIAGSHRLREMAKAGLIFAVQQGISQIADLDPSTEAPVDSLVEHIIDNFSTVAQIQFDQAREVMRDAIDGFIRLRADLKGIVTADEGHDDVLAALVAFKDLLRPKYLGFDAWEPGKHPRGQPGNAGEFASLGGGGGHETFHTPEPIDAKALKRVGPQMGSNPGGVFEGPAGKHFYVKQGQSKDHVRNELTAAALYDLAGAPTLKYRSVEGGNHVATEMEKLDKNNANKFTPDEIRRARRDFAADAWLANYDAVGTGGDNLVTIKGKPVRVDVGGALEYRAQGKPKGEQFGDTVNEIDGMRDPSINPDAAKVFGGITPAEFIESARRVTSITDDEIKGTVEALGGKLALADRLIKRRDDIAKRAKTFGADSDPKKKTSTVVFAKDADAPIKTLNGIPFKPWTPPADGDWNDVDGQVDGLDGDDPLPESVKKKQLSSGVLIQEKDGRVWIMRPKGGFGGYSHTFPKGRVEPALSMQANAIKEAFEETGLKVKIKDVVGDAEGDVTFTRYYLAERAGGDPKDAGLESDGSVLVPPEKLNGFLNRKRDRDIAKTVGATDQAMDAGWEEAKHPRDSTGRFAESAGGGAESPEAKAIKETAKKAQPLGAVIGAENEVKAFANADDPEKVNLVMFDKDGKEPVGQVYIVKKGEEKHVAQQMLGEPTEKEMGWEPIKEPEKTETFEQIKKYTPGFALEVTKIDNAEGEYAELDTNLKSGEAKIKAALKTDASAEAVELAMTAAEKEAVGKQYGGVGPAYEDIKAGTIAPAPKEGEKDKKTKFGGLWKVTGKGEDADIQFNAGILSNKQSNAGQSYRSMLTYIIKNGEKAGLDPMDVGVLKTKLAEALYKAQTKAISLGKPDDAAKIGKTIEKMQAGEPEITAAAWKNLGNGNALMAAPQPEPKPAPQSEPKDSEYAKALSKFAKATAAITAKAGNGDVLTANDKLNMAVGSGISMKDFVENISLKENDALKGYYGSIALAFAEKAKSVGDDANAAKQAATIAPVDLGTKEKPTDAELTKAKKSVPLQLQYVPNAPQTPEAQKLVDAFNSKWSGKELDDAGAHDKIKDFKALKEKMIPLMSATQKEAAEQAKKHHAANAEKQKAAAAEAAKKAEQVKAKNSNVMKQLGVSENEATGFHALVDMLGMNGDDDLIQQFKQHDTEAKHFGYPISGFQAALIKNYSDGGYASINSALREDAWTPAEHVYAKMVNKALKAMPQYTGTVYRGASLSKEQQQKYAQLDHVIREPAFMSTSTSGTKGGNTSFVIDAVGQHGASIKKLSHYPGENEVLFGAGTYFKINKVEGSPGEKMTVYLQEMED